MQKTQMIDDRTSIAYELKNPFASVSSIRAIEITQSTSADGWKYHKRKKRKR